MSNKSTNAFLERMLNMQEFGGFLNPSETPIEIRNEYGRLHSEVGPAYRSASRLTWYRDGQKHGMDADYFGMVVYYWKNVLVPSKFFLDRNNLTISEILKHPNTEVRSVGLHLYGYDRMESDGVFKVIDRDDDREMILYEFKDESLHEPLLLLKVKNSTAEKDGSYKYYFLCVPPNMTKCLEAVAWTFGKDSTDYHPVNET